MQDEHRNSLTFGTSAAQEILFEHFVSRLPTKLVTKLYRSSPTQAVHSQRPLLMSSTCVGKIVAKYHLAERGQVRPTASLSSCRMLTWCLQFRDKFDLSPEPLFVSYPAHGFGLFGIYALMRKLRT